MTSKTLSLTNNISLGVSLLKENLKRKVWAIALISLILFFVFPIGLALIAQSIRVNYRSIADIAEIYEREALNWLSMDSGMMITLMIMFAVLLGCNSFSYLHTKKRVDFYHGLPIPREVIYVVNWVSGAIIVGVPYIIMLTLGVFVAVFNGLPIGVAVSTAAIGMCFHMLYFKLIYSLVIVAVILTGNMIIGLLGSVFLTFLVPMGTALIEGIIQLSFDTYYSYGMGEVWDKLYRISPITDYIISVTNGEPEGVTHYLLVVGSVLVFFIVGGWLHKVRNSEMAGKAMAFEVSKMIFGTLITIYVSLFFGLMFYSMTESTAWSVFGVVCGAIISHCILQIIYHFDFKRLFAAKRHGVIVIAVSVLIFLGIKIDLIGYDSYIPEKDEIQSMAMNGGGLNGWVVSYGTPLNHGDYGWNYMDDRDYVFEWMEVTEFDNMYELAKKGIAAQHTNDSYDNEVERFEIKYELKNGRSVYRVYTLPLGEAKELLVEIFSQNEYKYGAFPVFNKEPDNIANIYTGNGDSTVLIENLSQEDRSEILSTYQEEFYELTYEQASKESAVGILYFETFEQEVMIDRIQENSNSYNPLLEEKNPVYPSFVKTLALLESYGITMDSKVEAADILQIQFDSWELGLASNEYNQIVIDQVDEVKAFGAVLDREIFYQFVIGNDHEVIFVEIVKKDGNMEYMYALKENVPQFIWDKVE